MTEVYAHLRSLHIAPRKVRVLATSLKGLSVRQASEALAFRPQRSALPLTMLLKSAIANARHNAGVTQPEDNMYIKNITVDEGKPMKRFQPRAQGRAAKFKRRTSHITLVLDIHDA